MIKQMLDKHPNLYADLSAVSPYMRRSSLLDANGNLDERWKELFEGEGLPTKLLPVGDILDWGERVPFRIMVPRGREHVADEILRKL